MKQFATLLAGLLIILPVLAQQNDTILEVVEEEQVPTEVEKAITIETEEAIEMEEPIEVEEPIETPEHTRVTLGENEVLIVEENGDTTKVVLGSKGLSIVEGEDGTEIKVMDMDENDGPSKEKKRKKRFRSNWAGIDVGLNNYLTPDRSMNLPSEERFMDLNTGKSWNWNLNIADFGIGLGTSYVGLVSGLGFEFINYSFDGQNSIRKDPVDGNIVEYVPDYAGSITKSKLNMTYVYAPLLLEFQIPAGGKRLHLSGGLLGGLKLWSNTKIKYQESGDKAKEKVRDDYNLAPLRWGLTARVGYRGIAVFANYYMTPLFKEAGGPELYPFTVGLAFGGW